MRLCGTRCRCQPIGIGGTGGQRGPTQFLTLLRANLVGRDWPPFAHQVGRNNRHRPWQTVMDKRLLRSGAHCPIDHLDIADMADIELPDILRAMAMGRDIDFTRCQREPTNSRRGP